MGDTARPTLAELQAQVTAEGTLDLSGYANRPGPLTALPEEIGQLQGLKKLNLDNNPGLMGVLPAALWTLPGLEELNLRGCGLVALTEAVGQLTGLKVLFLIFNHGLKGVLPAALWTLPGLEELNLSECGLAALPEAVGQLQGLKKLNLKFSPELRGCLPAALWTLPGLEELDLSGCGLAALPEAVGQLTGLKVLNLYNNFGLCSLPAGLAELEHLTTLDISGCPALATLHTLNEQGGAPAVQGYLRDLLSGGLFEPSLRDTLKLVLVGPTEAGKTNLLRALMHGESRVLADKDTERTIGLVISRLVLPDLTGQGRADVTFVVYDAGGHGEYQELHQPFFSTGAVYLLVWDVSNPLLQPIVAELCRWVTSIQACAPGATVLLVGSRADQAESATAAERSRTVVLERLRASLNAQRTALQRELEVLEPESMSAVLVLELEVLEVLEPESMSADARRIEQLQRLLASPLQLSTDALDVSAKTLNKVDLLKRRLLDTGFALPEFGSEQPWVYNEIAKQLGRIAAAGSPTLTWDEMAERLTSRQQPPAEVAVEVLSLGSVVEGTGFNAERMFQYQLILHGVVVLAPRAHYTEWSRRHRQLAAAKVAGLPQFPGGFRDTLHDMFYANYGQAGPLGMLHFICRRCFTEIEKLLQQQNFVAAGMIKPTMIMILVIFVILGGFVIFVILTILDDPWRFRERTDPAGGAGFDGPSARIPRT